MFKKIIFVFCNAFFLFFALPSCAFVSSELEDNSVYQDVRAYNRDFDILLLDVVIPDNGGEADVLRALSVYNTRTANDTDISKVTLWSDDGDGVWQGYMIDSEIASATKIDSRRWVFVDLDVNIPVGGLHIYVSAETDTDVTTNNRMQFGIDKLIDANSDGIYASGDAGLFVESGNDGPTDDNFVSNFVYTLENRTGDVLPPKIAISNVKNGDIFEVVDNFTVSGYGKDRALSQISSLSISLVPIGSDPVFNDANSLSVNFGTWDYTFSDLVAGDYALQTFASDGYGNSVISDAINIKFVEPSEEEEPEESEESTEEEPSESEDIMEPEENSAPTKPLNISDGDLIRAVGDFKVYIVSGSYKRWIQSPEIFDYYQHLNFAVVKEVSEMELAYYKESWLVRADGDEKVYEINGDGTKHWLNMTPENFVQSGRSWDMVYLINKQEVDFYEVGADVIG